jgi:hypothetical protein
MTCNCIEQMDAKLKERNTRLCVTFGFPRDGSPTYTLPALMTEKINKRNRESVLAIPTFYPFCGERYVPKPETSES